MKKIRKYVATLLSLTMIFLLNATALAVEPQKPTEAPAVDTIGLLMTKNRSVASPEDLQEAESLGMEFVGKITNPVIIQDLVDLGLVDRSKGKNPISITRYFAESETDDEPTIRVAASSALISVTASEYYNGQYFDDYDRYVLVAGSTLNHTHTKTGSRSWNHSMTGNMQVGGNVVTILDVQGAVEGSLGYTLGTTETVSRSISYTATRNVEYRIWISYRVHTWSAKISSITIATGKAWRPNGFVTDVIAY